jgi:protein TonB
MIEANKFAANTAVMFTRFLLPLVLLLLSLGTFAQDTTFYNSKGFRVYSRDSAEWFRVLLRDRVDTLQATAREYNKEGLLTHEERYSDYRKRLLNGPVRSWKEGRVVLEGEFVNDKRHGLLRTYWDNGQLRRTDRFDNGRFVEGFCCSTTGSDTAYFVFEQKPEYPGGLSALYRYLSGNLKYPDVARKDGIEGTVLVQFIVDRDGALLEPTVSRSIQKDLDAEALRVVRRMPAWTPGIREGLPVKFRFTLPVTFRLQ